ncbi:putative modified peptide [Pseudolysobacter antarcticus]|uniref:Putative modified peptide n=1 Tax=Pseudolysobacter antarcticus TaxID=2511995 RepID=A0A411HEV3_9GAMM|nr:NHLP-related RiPP peptide [Pseudolysobacter antarcticus]QBB69007.1 putative modified peptide [Pseudolysobacter antarcticus]
MAGEPLPQNVVETLLDKLATDDTFRDLFQNDQEAALKQIGLKNPKNYCECAHPPKLPSKQAIEQTRTALQSQLTSNLGMMVFKA